MEKIEEDFFLKHIQPLNLLGIDLYEKGLELGYFKGLIRGVSAAMQSGDPAVIKWASQQKKLIEDTIEGKHNDREKHSD